MSGAGTITVIPSGKKGTGNSPVGHPGAVCGTLWLRDGHAAVLQNTSALVAFISSFFLLLELIPRLARRQTGREALVFSLILP